jgi:hypothetical protein
MTITIDGPGVVADFATSTDLIELVDRVGAAGGELSVASVDGHTVVTAVLPCAS